MLLRHRIDFKRLVYSHHTKRGWAIMLRQSSSSYPSIGTISYQIRCLRIFTRKSFGQQYIPIIRRHAINRGFLSSFKMCAERHSNWLRIFCWIYSRYHLSFEGWTISQIYNQALQILSFHWIEKVSAIAQFGSTNTNYLDEIRDGACNDFANGATFLSGEL